MSSTFRNNRIIIASLFLPNTVVIGQEHSGKSTPDSRHRVLRDGPLVAEPPSDLLASDLLQRLKKDTEKVAPVIRGGGSLPLKSIVEDMRDRSSRKPSLSTPGPTSENPFSSLITIATPTGSPVKAKFDGPTPVPSLNKDTMSSPRSPPPRRRRSSQRNSSRRRSSSRTGLTSPTLAEKEEHFYIDANSHCNGGLKNAIESVSATSMRPSSISGRPADPPRLRKKLWVGTLGSSGQNSYSPALRQSISSRMRGDHEGEIVWCDDAVFDSAYDGFCHQVLWPALHYAVPDAPRTKLFYESASFKDYVALNQFFANVIKSIWREGDIIWVNDYHLMLLPAMLRASGIPVSAPIGFFMHVAFPSSEIFRCFSVRESLLRGVLGADLIGFQTTSYARHFRQTVSRILAVEALPRGIQLSPEFDFDENGNPREVVASPNSKTKSQITSGAGGRFVDVGVFPMGIDVAQLKEKIRDPEVTDWVSLLKQRYSGMKILVGRDKLDEIQGVRQKIQAFEFFLDKYKEYQGKVVLIQVALPTASPDSTTSSQANPDSIASNIIAPVSHINSRFSTLTYQPVVFLQTQDVSFSQYLALLTVADAFVVTSLREGMALRTHEYVVAQEGREKPLILSEFTGSYSYSGFRSCIAINPWDTRGTAAAIHQALTMSEQEAHSRWEDLHNHVVAQTAQAFVTSFLTRCLRSNAEHLHIYRSGGSGQDADHGPVPNMSENIGRVMGRWKHSEKRLILLDWEGTLVLHQAHGIVADEERKEREIRAALEILKILSKDQKNEVWLLSGLRSDGVLSRVAAEVPRIGIVAENGCFVKPRPFRGSISPPWVSLVANLNMTWRDSCVEMLKYYTERTPGSLVEARVASIVWRFWTGAPNDDCSDRQWAKRQAAEAQNHIFDSLGERYGLRIIPGANSFLVIPNNISRSTAVGSILHIEGSTHSPLSNTGHAPWMSPDPDMSSSSTELDFVLAVSADEKLLRRVNNMDHSETCSTGEKGTDAKWKLQPKEVANVLTKFAEACGV